MSGFDCAKAMALAAGATSLQPSSPPKQSHCSPRFSSLHRCVTPFPRSIPPSFSHRPSSHSHSVVFPKKQILCTYSTGASEYSTDPIDVVAQVQTKKIVVLGGNGFVGSAVCKAAVGKGIEVASLSRSGRPSYDEAWMDQVTWVAGDVFYTDWDNLFNGAMAVVSTLGGFGTNEQMEKLNGDANVLAINAASNAGVPRFVYISVHDYNVPTFFKNVGYFNGKKRAEAEVLTKFPNTGTILRPGFIYGKRRVDGIEVPLDIIGKPLEKLLSATEVLTRPLSSIPASDLIILPPVSVDDVAFAVIKAVTDNDVFGIQTVEQIKELAAEARA